MPPPRGLAAALAALALAAGAAPALAADPAEGALRDRDAYVDPVALGDAAPAAERALQREADAFAAEDRPVKLALVRGPAGARSLSLYARRLAHRIGFAGTLVVTTPRRRTAAVGPRPTAEMTRALRGIHVAAIRDPVARLTRAAEVAAPIPDPPSRWTPTLVLLGLAIAGGAWAAAAGAGRRERGRRRALAEGRARTRLELDAMRARAMVLVRTPGGPPPATRARAQRALGLYADGVAALQASRTPEDLERLGAQVREGLAEVAAAAGTPDAPFSGLCAADPAHGAASGEGLLADVAEPVRLCAGCLTAAEEGRPAHRRRLPVGGRPVPYDELEPVTTIHG